MRDQSAQWSSEVLPWGHIEFLHGTILSSAEAKLCSGHSVMLLFCFVLVSFDKG